MPEDEPWRLSDGAEAAADDFFAAVVFVVAAGLTSGVSSFTEALLLAAAAGFASDLAVVAAGFVSVLMAAVLKAGLVEATPRRSLLRTLGFDIVPYVLANAIVSCGCACSRTCRAATASS